MTSAARVRVKICGVTNEDDARACVRAGADAIGVNFVAASPRRVDVEQARKIARAVRAAGDVVVIGVVANESTDAMRALLRDAELTRLQLHGEEPPETLTALSPGAYKALRIGGPEDVARARDYAGDWLLADARVPGVLGGSGAVFDWTLVMELARTRKLILAGGLNASNVERAVSIVRPYAVDVASGVEVAGDARRKDPERIAQFIAAVRAAAK